MCHKLNVLCTQKGSEVSEAVRAKLTKIQHSFGDPFEQVCVCSDLSARLCGAGLLVPMWVSLCACDCGCVSVHGCVGGGGRCMHACACS